MVYSEILTVGHWDSFLRFLWKRGGDINPLNSTYNLWKKEFEGKEDIQLKKLYKDTPDKLYELLREYFGEFSHQKDLCVRCNRDFRNDKESCNLCGWHSRFFVQKGEVFQQAININQKIHLKFINNKIEEAKLNVEFDQIDKEVIHYSSESERMEKEIKILESENHELTQKSQSFQDRKAELEERAVNIEDEINQVEKILKNAESLFLYFDNQNASREIRLKIIGEKLIACSKSSVRFPIDLVMGLQKTKDRPPAKTINKSACFLFLYKEDWERNTKDEWVLDLKKVAKGKVTGEYYASVFSHLHKKDYLINIKYDIKRITFFDEEYRTRY